MSKKSGGQLFDELLISDSISSKKKKVQVEPEEAKLPPTGKVDSSTQKDVDRKLLYRHRFPLATTTEKIGAFNPSRLFLEDHIKIEEIEEESPEAKEKEKEKEKEIQLVSRNLDDDMHEDLKESGIVANARVNKANFVVSLPLKRLYDTCPDLNGMIL